MAVWLETIEVGDALNDESLPFEERRDAIVQAIKASRWYAEDKDGDCEVELLVDDLAVITDEDGFDVIWYAIYDKADEDGVWLNPLPRQQSV